MTSTHPLFGAVFTAYNPPTAQFLSGQILRPVTDLLTALHTLERDASALITSIADYASNYALLAKYVDDDGRGSEAVRGSLADELGIPVVALREKVLVRLQKCVERLGVCL